MKNSEKHTNKKLKQLSDQHEVPFNEGAWERMETMLDSKPDDSSNRKRKLYFLTTIFAAMITLFIIFFWWLLPLGDTTSDAQQTAQNQTSELTEQITNPITSDNETLTTSEIETNDVFTLGKKQTTPEPKFDLNPNATAYVAPNFSSQLLPPVNDSNISYKNIYYTQSPPDTSLVNDLKGQLDKYNNFRAEEKVYVHFDRTFIKPGESIWMSAYVRDANTLHASTQSDIVYVQFIAPNGGVLKELKLVANNGIAKGDIQTTTDLVGGIYKVKAYTNWQRNFNEFFEREITIQKAVLPHLRMELDIEREAYGAGDEVMADLDLKTLENQPLKNHAFEYEASLDGNAITKLKGTTDENGNAKLKFSLPKNLNTNDGIVNVMLQYNGLSESISRSIPIILNTMDLQFFPEGGDLVAGMDNKIAFKALNEFGKPADVEGVILNKNKTIVARFKSYHQGMGAVNFSPKKGEQYKAIITQPKGIKGDYKLPEPLEYGYAMQVLSIGKEKMEVTVENNENESLTLSLQAQGKIYNSVSTIAKAGVHHLEIPISNLPIGIAQLTLFDKKQRPHAERLVFLNQHKTLDISITTDKEKYLPREKVKMTIDVKDEHGNAVEGNFSVAVTDDKLLSFADDKQGNMLAYLLLESDLKGDVLEPNFYFEKKKKNTEKDQQLALDYLMMTNGWRRYTWKVNQKPLATMTYPNERALVSGVVVDQKNNPVEDAIVTIYGTTKNFITDKDGRFEFSGLPLQVGHRNNSYVNLVATKGNQNTIQVRQYGDDYKIVIHKPAESPIAITELTDDAQTIKGKVTDNNGEELIGASVFLRGTDIGVSTDIDGNFVIKDVPEGKYALEVNYIGYGNSSKIVNVKDGKGLLANVELSDAGVTLSSVEVTSAKRQSSIFKKKRKREATPPPPVVMEIPEEEVEENVLDEIVVKQYAVPLIDVDKTTSGGTVTSEQIRNLPTRNINSVAAQTAGLSSNEEGQAVSIKGSRSNATDYYIDGVRVRGNLLPDSELESIQIITGGIPAQFAHEDDLNPIGWGTISDQSITQASGSVATTESKEIIVRDGTKNSNPPLIMVDGKQRALYNTHLSPKDIASVAILKNESATKKYGNSAINGAIEIETRKAKNNIGSGKTSNKELKAYYDENLEKLNQHLNRYHNQYIRARRNIENGLLTQNEASQFYNELHAQSRLIYIIQNNVKSIGRLAGEYPSTNFTPVHRDLIQNFGYAMNFKKGFYTAREFYVPKYQSTDIPNIRDDFRPTVFWNPMIQTNANGSATIEFYNSDDLTTFRATVEGMTPSGQLGRNTQTYFTQLPFGMRTKLPVNVLTGDELIIPVTVSNNTDTDKKIGFMLDFPDGFEPMKQIPANFELAPNSSKTYYFPFKIKSEEGIHEIKIQVKSKDHQDVFSKKIKVLSRGFPVHEIIGGNALKDNFKVNINEPIEGSMKATFTVHPSVLSDLSEGMKRMIRQPTGCFEQTSSKNYPNVLVLDYLKSSKKLDQNFAATLDDVLEKGYRRLLTFEVEGGGFDWYGRAPAHEGLTAYGLMQFNDMKEVHRVKQDVINRTANWLLSRKDGSGGWKTSKRALHRWSGSNPIGDAYITWAMTEAGYGNQIKAEIEKTYTDATSSKDPYMMALAAMALQNVKDARSEKLVTALLKMQTKNGSWNGLSKSMTHSTGKALAIETTALTALAIMKTEKLSTHLNKAMEFLAAAKSPYGFGNTQSTVLAMKALVKYEQLQKEERTSGWVKLFIDGKEIQDATYGKDQNNAIIFDNLEEHFTTGKHNVKVLFENTTKALPYDLSISYSTTLPKNDKDCKVNLKTSLNNSKGKTGENIRLNVELKNTTNEPLPNTIAKIGIPAGLNVQHWQLKEMMDKGMFDYYEIMSGYLVLHYRGMDENEIKNIPLDLKADLAGSYEAPASVAYLYYTNELQNWSKPSRVDIVTE